MTSPVVEQNRIRRAEETEKLQRQQEAINRVNRIYGIGQMPLFQLEQRQATNKRGQPVTQYFNTKNGKQLTQAKYNQLSAKNTRRQKANAPLDKALADREANYSNIADEVRKYRMNNIDYQNQQAGRNITYQMARQGLAGGSADVDRRADLFKQYNDQVLDTSNAAQTAANDARNQDEQTRQSVISRIIGGLQSGDAVQASLEGMRNNQASALSQGLINATGQIFGQFADTGAAYQQGRQYGQLQRAAGGYGKDTAGSISKTG